MAFNIHDIQIPEKKPSMPMIGVMGVGGAGVNSVTNMINSDLKGIFFIVANTDQQSLDESPCDTKIQLGVTLTKGLGAGAAPEVGQAAARESLDEIKEYLQNINMLFITGGMGGGTGTGAAPVIAQAAKEMGILTIGVVTKPFNFEGQHRMRTAIQGLKELEKYLDTLIVIPNQNLFSIANETTTFEDAFKMADNVLRAGVEGVTNLIIKPGLVNLDFADISAVMREMGKAMMGTGEASGEDRARRAAEAAIFNPLLDTSSMRGAKGVLINITGGKDMTLFEVDTAVNLVKDQVGETEANIIFGSALNADLNGIIRVSVVASGIDAEKNLSEAKLNQDKANLVDTAIGNQLNNMLAEHSSSSGSYGQEIDELLKFDQYDLASSEDKNNASESKIRQVAEAEELLNKKQTIEQQSYNTNTNSSIAKQPVQAQPNYVSTSVKKVDNVKPSFFSRIASSILGSSSQDKNEDNSENDSKASHVDHEHYEVPAFLRNKKK